MNVNAYEIDTAFTIANFSQTWKRSFSLSSGEKKLWATKQVKEMLFWLNISLKSGVIKYIDPTISSYKFPTVIDSSDIDLRSFSHHLSF